MICSNCARLNPDDKQTCQFCASANENNNDEINVKPVEMTLEEAYAVEGEPQKGTKYVKYGLGLLIAAVLCAVTVIIAVALNATAAHKKTVDGYFQGYFNGDFGQTTAFSAVDLNKLYSASTKASLSNLFGLFNPSYEEFCNIYKEAFSKEQSNRQSKYGYDYKIKVDIKKSKTVKSDEMNRVISNYTANNVDVLKSGEKGKMKLVTAKVTLSGKEENSDSFSVYVIEIDSEWYVLNDDFIGVS